ncbi:MAG: DNA-processing protein DprA, partial [Candidatus Omnitrophota bacterium]
MLLNMASGIGPVRLEGLLKRFGSLSAILSAQKKDFEKIENIGPLIAGSLYDGLKNRGLLDKEASLVKKHKLSVVTILDNDYPRLLKGIHNPPLVLYVKGTLDDAGIPNIAVVGSRRASVYGLGFAESVSY